MCACFDWLHGLRIVLLGPGRLIFRSLNNHQEFNAAPGRFQISWIAQLLEGLNEHLDAGLGRAIIERVIRGIVRKAIVRELMTERIALGPGAIRILSEQNEVGGFEEW